MQVCFVATLKELRRYLVIGDATLSGFAPSVNGGFFPRVAKANPGLKFANALSVKLKLALPNHGVSTRDLSGGIAVVKFLIAIIWRFPARLCYHRITHAIFK